MPQVTLEALRKVPYLEVDALEGRMPYLMPLWDGTEWHVWVPRGDDLFEMKPSDARGVDYVAATPFDESDVFIPFVDLMWQRASWPFVRPLITAIIEDFHNMGTSVAKLHSFVLNRDRLPEGLAARFAETEFEYLITLCRSVFDLLQEMISRLWQNVVCMDDPEAEAFRKAHVLPTSFAPMVVRNGEVLTASAIETIRGIPAPLAQAYERSAVFFVSLRDVRTRILHSGCRIGTVYDTSCGFCVDPSEPPFDGFDGWLDAHHFNERLVTVLPWVAHLIASTMGACDDLARAFAGIVRLPGPVAPGYRIFVRAPTTSYLFDIVEVAHGAPGFWVEEGESASA